MGVECWAEYLELPQCCLESSRQCTSSPLLFVCNGAEYTDYVLDIEVVSMKHHE